MSEAVIEFARCRHHYVQPKASGDAILARIAAETRVTVADLKGRRLSRKYAWPRQRAYFELYATGRHSMEAIAAFMGGRDHTTVQFGIRRHKQRSAQP